MSGVGRRSDSLAPSLFPFLAVLLCTMGALVLILMLLVAGAQNSAKEVSQQVDEEFQLEQEKIRLVKNGLSRKYEDSKIELEKKRLLLQHYEKHIQELMQELKDLENKAAQANQTHDTQSQTLKERDELREALEKQLADAKKKLDKKIDDPNGDKPIFAIIPYDGPNGTHRRPIYLECNEHGVVVQPEGVVLTPADLQPPYGPGNPLDAVLRTIRAEFPSKNGSVTYNPYPLLVVRPNGIKHYMMAKAAMSGWDDQHGYELISQDLELTFPPSVPDLEEKIVSTIELARQRQAALVMAMPQHYDAAQLESFGPGGLPAAANLSDFDDKPLDFGAQGTGNRESTGLRPSSGGRGGVAMGGRVAGGGSNLDAIGRNIDGQNALTEYGMSKAGKDGAVTMAQSLSSRGAGQGGVGQFDVAQGESTRAGQGSQGETGSGDMSFFGSGNSRGGTFGQSNDMGSGSSNSGTSSNSGNQYAAGGATDISSDGGAATVGTGSGGSNSQGSGSASGSTSTNRRSSLAASGQMASGGSAGTAAPLGGGSQSMNSLNNSNSGSSSSSSSSPTNMDPSQATGVPSLNMDFSNKPNENVKPVAQSRGRDWAWRDGNRSKTAIVRAIRMQCYEDQWVLLPEKGNNDKPIIIDFNGPPIVRAEKLAQSVGQRVEGWGLAVTEGHWSPVLHVDVAQDAEWRFQQLQRLMEGSGIEVIRKSTISPTRNSRSSSSMKSSIGK